MTLAKLTFWMLVVLIVAWIWRGYGVREKALSFVFHYCKSHGIQLLDQNVAFAGWRVIKDKNQQKRLARRYTFEFTVTTQERLIGEAFMFGSHPANIILPPYPYPQAIQKHEQSYTQDKVVDINNWKNQFKR